MRIWGVLALVIVLSALVYAQSDLLSMTQGLYGITISGNPTDQELQILDLSFHKIDNSLVKGKEFQIGDFQQEISSAENKILISHNIFNKGNVEASAIIANFLSNKQVNNYNKNNLESKYSIQILGDITQSEINIIGEALARLNDNSLISGTKFLIYQDYEFYINMIQQNEGYKREDIIGNLNSPSPALSVPSKKLIYLSGDTFNGKRDDLSIFIILHEFGHIKIGGDKSSNEIEKASDDFAVSIMGYNAYLGQNPNQVLTFSSNRNTLKEPTDIQQSIPQVDQICLASEDLKYKCEIQSPFNLVRCTNRKWTATSQEFSSKDNCIDACKKYQSNCLEVTPFYRYISYASGLNRFSQLTEEKIKNTLESIQNEKGIRIMLRITNAVEDREKIFNELKLNEGPAKDKNILLLYNILDLRGAVVHSKICNVDKINEVLKSDSILGELKKDPQPQFFPTENKETAFVNAVNQIKDVIDKEACAGAEGISKSVIDFIVSLKTRSIEPKYDIELRSTKAKNMVTVIGKSIGISDASIKELSDKIDINIKNNIYNNLLKTEIKSLDRRISALKNKSSEYNILEFAENKYTQSDLGKEKTGVEIIQKCLSEGMEIKEIEKDPNKCYSKKGVIEFFRSLVGLTDEITYALKYNPRVLYILEIEKANTPFPDSCNAYFNVAQNLEKQQMYDKAIASYQTAIAYCNRYGYKDISNRADTAVNILSKGSFGKGLWESAKSLTSPINVGIIVGTIVVSYVAPPLGGALGGEAGAIIAARTVTTAHAVLHTYFLGTITVSLSKDLGECTALGINTEQCGKAVGDATFLLALLSNTPKQIESLKSLKTEIDVQNSVNKNLDDAIKKTQDALKKDPENVNLKTLLEELNSAKQNKYATIMASKLVAAGDVDLNSLTLSIDLDSLLKNTESSDAKLVKQITEEVNKADKDNIEPIKEPDTTAQTNDVVKNGPLMENSGGSIKVKADVVAPEKPGLELTLTKTGNGYQTSFNSDQYPNYEAYTEDPYVAAQIALAKAKLIDLKDSTDLGHGVTFKDIPPEKIPEIQNKLEQSGLVAKQEIYLPTGNTASRVLIQYDPTQTPGETSGGLYRVNFIENKDIAPDGQGSFTETTLGYNIQTRIWPGGEVKILNGEIDPSIQPSIANKIIYDVLKDDIANGLTTVTDAAGNNINDMFKGDTNLRSDTSLKAKIESGQYHEIKPGAEIDQGYVKFGEGMYLIVDSSSDVKLSSITEKSIDRISKISDEKQKFDTIVQTIKENVPYNSEALYKEGYFLVGEACTVGGTCKDISLMAAAITELVGKNKMFTDPPIVRYDAGIGHVFAKATTKNGRYVLDPSQKSRAVYEKDFYIFGTESEFANPITNVNENAIINGISSYDGMNLMPNSIDYDNTVRVEFHYNIDLNEYLQRIENGEKLDNPLVAIFVRDSQGKEFVLPQNQQQIFLRQIQDQLEREAYLSRLSRQDAQSLQQSLSSPIKTQFTLSIDSIDGVQRPANIFYDSSGPSAMTFENGNKIIFESSTKATYIQSNGAKFDLEPTSAEKYYNNAKQIIGSP